MRSTNPNGKAEATVESEPYVVRIRLPSGHIEQHLVANHHVVSDKGSIVRVNMDRVDGLPAPVYSNGHIASVTALRRNDVEKYATRRTKDGRRPCSGITKDGSPCPWVEKPEPLNGYCGKHQGQQPTGPGLSGDPFEGLGLSDDAELEILDLKVEFDSVEPDDPVLWKQIKFRFFGDPFEGWEQFDRACEAVGIK